MRDDIEIDSERIESDIQECLDRTGRSLGLLERMARAASGPHGKAIRGELGKLNRRRDRLREAFRQITASPAEGRTETRVRLQIAVKDLELAVLQARAKHDAGRAVRTMADLFATHRW
jgi:hypothetical protein